jgi:hypothetical protein
MPDLRGLLLPTGIGVLIVVLGSIVGIWNQGLQAARTGPIAVSNFLVGFITLIVLVMLVLAIFGAIRDAA